jgi:hypothetical protein
VLKAVGGMCIAVLVVTGAPAFAVPLDPAACSGLEGERGNLLSSGVLDDLHLTATEAAALPKERVLRVQRYVEVSGQILFRCQVAAKPDAEPGDASAADVPAEPDAAAPSKSRRPLSRRRTSAK